MGFRAARVGAALLGGSWRPVEAGGGGSVRRRRRGPGTVRRRVAAARGVRGKEQGWGHWSSRFPVPNTQLAACFDSGRRPSILQPRPLPLGPPRSRGQGAGGGVELGSLIHSFSADGSLRPAVL